MQQSLKEIGPPFNPSGNETHASRACSMLGIESQVPFVNHAMKIKKNYSFIQFTLVHAPHPAHTLRKPMQLAAMAYMLLLGELKGYCKTPSYSYEETSMT